MSEEQILTENGPVSDGEDFDDDESHFTTISIHSTNNKDIYGNLEGRPGDKDDDEVAIKDNENGIIEHPPPSEITTAANIEINDTEPFSTAPTAQETSLVYFKIN